MLTVGAYAVGREAKGFQSVAADAGILVALGGVFLWLGVLAALAVVLDLGVLGILAVLAVFRLGVLGILVHGNHPFLKLFFPYYFLVLAGIVAILQGSPEKLAR